MSDSSNNNLDPSLRDLAQATHPRPDFVARLRGELSGAQPKKSWLGWARRFAPSAALVLALIGLVALGLELTPHLLGPARRASQGGTPVAGNDTTGVGGGPNLAQGELARLGKGAILWLDSTPDGRLAVASTASVCVYQKDMTEEWCLWPQQPALWAGFDPTGAFLAVKFLDGTIEKLDASNGEGRGSYQPPNGQPAFAVENVAWDPTGAQRIAVAEPVYPNVPAPTATSPADAIPTNMMLPTQAYPGVAAYPGAKTGQGPLPQPTADLSVTTKVSVWDWESQKTVWGPVSIPGAARAAAWAKGQGGESLLAVGGDNGLVLFDGATGEIRQQFDPTWQAAPIGNIASLVFAPDGSWLVYDNPNGVRALEIRVGKVDGKILAWPIWTGISPTHLAWGVDKTFAALVGPSIYIFNFDNQGGYEISSPSGVNGLASRIDQRAWYHSLPDGSLALDFHGQDPVLLSNYTFSQTALIWKNAAEIIGAGHALYTWDIARQAVSNVQQASLPAGSGPLTLLNFLTISPDGKRAVTLGNVLLDAVSGKVISRLEPGFTNDKAVFSPDGARVAFGSSDGRVVVYAVDTQQVELDVQAIPVGAHLTGLAWGASPGPESDPIAVTWQRTDGSGSGGVNLLTASGIGKGQSGTVIERKSYLELPSFSADGKWLAVADSSGQAIVWSVADGKERYTLDTAGSASALAFSPDGRFLAGASRSAGFILWDLDNGQEVKRFGGQGQKVNAMAFSPDGKIIASASADGTLSLWDAGGGKLPDRIPAERTPLPGELDQPYPPPSYTLTPPEGYMPPTPTGPTSTITLTRTPAPTATPIPSPFEQRYPPPSHAPTATPILGTPAAQGNAAITGQIVLGYGSHAPVTNQPIYIQEPAQPGGSTDPLAVTTSAGRFDISGLAPGHYRFASMHLEFTVDIPEGAQVVDLGQVRYPLIHPPSFYNQSPQPVDLQTLVEKGEYVPYTFLYRDAEWTRPPEAEQREKIWSWAAGEPAVINQGGEAMLKEWFNKPAFLFDTIDRFTRTYVEAPDAYSLTVYQPGQDFRYLLGLWNRPSFLTPEMGLYNQEVLEDLLNRRQVEVWLMGYEVDDTQQQGAPLQALRRMSDGASGGASGGANGMQYALKVHPAPGFQVIRFNGNGPEAGSGVMQVHVISEGQEIAALPPTVAPVSDDASQAEQVVRDFLTNLSQGKSDPAAYQRAAELYDRHGSVGNPDVIASNAEDLRKGCDDTNDYLRFTCLPVLQTSPVEQLSADHYRVWIQFKGDDGTAWSSQYNLQQWFDINVLRSSDGKLRVVSDPPNGSGSLAAFIPETELAGLDDLGKVKALWMDYLERSRSQYLNERNRIEEYSFVEIKSSSMKSDDGKPLYIVTFQVKPTSQNQTSWGGGSSSFVGDRIHETLPVLLYKEGNYYYLKITGLG